MANVKTKSGPGVEGVSRGETMPGPGTGILFDSYKKRKPESVPVPWAGRSGIFPATLIMRLGLLGWARGQKRAAPKPAIRSRPGGKGFAIPPGGKRR